MIKHIHSTMTNIILQTFNRIYDENIFPNTWRTAIIIPIAKPRENHTNPLNYRPIALTSCLCKLIEKIINLRLMWCLEGTNLMANVQSGFIKKNRSTTAHLRQHENDIQNNIFNRQHTIVVFFKLTKAYDTAWKYSILKKLQDFGLRGDLTLFIRNFLSCRKIKVKVGNTFSNTIPTLEGVPQGSVISCTCFIVAMNDISNNLPASIKSTPYVDDCAIYASGISTISIERRLQISINGLYDWSNNTGFNFSPSKTVSLHICRKRNCTKMAPNLHLNNNPIICVAEYKFLGLTFDNSLTWKKHISTSRIPFAIVHTAD